MLLCSVTGYCIDQWLSDYVDDYQIIINEFPWTCDTHTCRRVFVSGAVMTSNNNILDRDSNLDLLHAKQMRRM